MRISTTKLQNAFGRYLNEVLNGSEIIVTKNGRGVAKMVKYTDPTVGSVDEEAADYYGKHYMTYEDFTKLTGKSEGRYELIGGQIYMLASPNHFHQSIVQEINIQIYSYLSDKSCNVYTSPYDVKLYNDSDCFEDDPNIVQPDILVICDEENIDGKGRYQGIPTLIVEVVSKSTLSKDLVKKLNLYMMSGIKEYWIVNPLDNSITLYNFIERQIDKVKRCQFGEVIESITFNGLHVSTDSLH